MPSVAEQRGALHRLDQQPTQHRNWGGLKWGERAQLGDRVLVICSSFVLLLLAELLYSVEVHGTLTQWQNRLTVIEIKSPPWSFLSSPAGLGPMCTR